MLTDTQITEFKARLLAEKADLEAVGEASKDARARVELDQTAVGRVSRIDAMQQQQMALATARRREVQLARIASALARIDAGDYGYCVVCDEEIPLARLRHDPATPTCITCAGSSGGEGA